MDKDYKKFLLQHQLTDKKIGEILGYASRQSWNGAERRPKVIRGLLQIIKLIQQRKDFFVTSDKMRDVGHEFADWIHLNYISGPNPGTWFDKDFKGNLNKHVPYTTKQIWKKFMKQY